jgi:hypothetical protein
VQNKPKINPNKKHQPEKQHKHNLNNLPKDILLCVAEWLVSEDIFKLCVVNRYFSTLQGQLLSKSLICLSISEGIDFNAQLLRHKHTPILYKPDRIVLDCRYSYLKSLPFLQQLSLSSEDKQQHITAGIREFCSDVKHVVILYIAWKEDVLVSLWTRTVLSASNVLKTVELRQQIYGWHDMVNTNVWLDFEKCCHSLKILILDRHPLKSAINDTLTSLPQLTCLALTHQVTSFDDIYNALIQITPNKPNKPNKLKALLLGQTLQINNSVTHDFSRLWQYISSSLKILDIAGWHSVLNEYTHDMVIQHFHEQWSKFCTSTWRKLTCLQIGLGGGSGRIVFDTLAHHVVCFPKLILLVVRCFSDYWVTVETADLTLLFESFHDKCYIRFVNVNNQCVNMLSADAFQTLRTHNDHFLKNKNHKDVPTAMGKDRTQLYGATHDLITSLSTWGIRT